jgi:FkbM family methyltransferase
MKALLKSIIRTAARKTGYIVLDLRKDQPTFHFQPGHLRKVFARSQVNCVIDVGANVGHFALMLRDIGFTGRIVSVEPTAASYAVLSDKASRDDTWKTLNVALGDRDEEKLLNIFGAGDLNSFLSPTTNMSANLLNSEITQTEAVVVKKLDTIFDEISDGIPDPRVFLKLDTQGYDLKVMNGALQSLPSIVAIQSEMSVIPLYEGMTDYLEALAFYRKLGFEPTGVFPLELERNTGHVLEFDVVLTRREAQGVAPTSVN